MSPSESQINLSPLSLKTFSQSEEEKVNLKKEQLKEMEELLIEKIEQSRIMQGFAQSSRVGLTPEDKKALIEVPFRGLLIDEGEEQHTPKIHPIFEGNLGKYLVGLKRFQEYVKWVGKLYDKYDKSLEGCIAFLYGEEWSEIDFLHRLSGDESLTFFEETRFGRARFSKCREYNRGQNKNSFLESTTYGEYWTPDYNGCTITATEDLPFEQKVREVIEVSHGFYNSDPSIPLRDVASVFRQGLISSGMPVVEE